jgi:hypothetical protein
MDDRDLSNITKSKKKKDITMKYDQKEKFSF